MVSLPFQLENKRVSLSQYCMSLARLVAGLILAWSGRSRHLPNLMAHPEKKKPKHLYLTAQYLLFQCICSSVVGIAYPSPPVHITHRYHHMQQETLGTC